MEMQPWRLLSHSWRPLQVVDPSVSSMVMEEASEASLKHEGAKWDDPGYIVSSTCCAFLCGISVSTSCLLSHVLAPHRWRLYVSRWALKLWDFMGFLIVWHQWHGIKRGYSPQVLFGKTTKLEQTLWIYGFLPWVGERMPRVSYFGLLNPCDALMRNQVNMRKCVIYIYSAPS